MNYDQGIWVGPVLFATSLFPFVLLCTPYDGAWSIWKRISIIVFDGMIIVAIVELLFVILFRMDGSGRHDYGVAFQSEQIVRSHLNQPCVWQGGTICSQEALDRLHRETTVDFWLDVYEKSVPFILVSLAVLCLCILVMVSLEYWKRRLRTRTPSLL